MGKLTFEEFAGKRYTILRKESNRQRHLYMVQSKVLRNTSHISFIWWNDLSGGYGRVIPEGFWCNIDDFWKICVKELKK